MTSIAPAPAPSPARAAEDASAIIVAALNVVCDGADVAATLELFAADLSSNGGVASTLVSSPVRIAIARDAAAAARSLRVCAPPAVPPLCHSHGCRSSRDPEEEGDLRALCFFLD